VISSWTSISQSLAEQARALSNKHHVSLQPICSILPLVVAITFLVSFCFQRLRYNIRPRPTWGPALDKHRKSYVSKMGVKKNSSSSEDSESTSHGDIIKTPLTDDLPV
jgi:hypothetical protein